MDGATTKASVPLGLATASHSVIYDIAKNDWDFRIREVGKQRNYACIGAAAATAIALAMAGIAYKAAQPRIETVIVEVGALGDAVATSVAPVKNRQDLTVSRYQVANFIINLRSVLSDSAGEKRNMNALFAAIANPSPALETVREWFGDSDNLPLVRAAKEVVDVDVSAVTVVGDQPALGGKGYEGGNTWRVEWTETARTRDGRLNYRRTYVATLVTTIKTPITVDEAKVNPTGLFVRQLSVSEKGGRQGG